MTAEPPVTARHRPQRRAFLRPADALLASAVAFAFNRIACDQRLDHQLRELDGRSVSVRVIGPSVLELHFLVRSGRIEPAGGRTADVTISGHVAEFVRLAARLEDPDTLFFQRRLRIEGDTDTGVHVKNLLDTLDLDPAVLFEARLGPRVAAALRSPLGIAQQVVQRLTPLVQRGLDAISPPRAAAPASHHSPQVMPGKPRQ
jgi:predicted lipid carrier protein YhbT